MPKLRALRSTGRLAQQSPAVGEDDSAGHTLACPEDDQERQVRGGGGGHRRGQEGQQPGQEQAAVAEAVAELARRRLQRGDGDQVAGDEPARRGRAESKSSVIWPEPR